MSGPGRQCTKPHGLQAFGLDTSLGIPLSSTQHRSAQKSGHEGKARSLLQGMFQEVLDDLPSFVHRLQMLRSDVKVQRLAALNGFLRKEV
mmetsp:Transcript_52428/g.105048  ORF Transcript_52428/g.105048 Transcript_52428/m.105048 type:complete len:90 (+) Transcript_52428:179-448(+)